MKKILHVFSTSMSIEPFIGEQINYFQEIDCEIHVACSSNNIEKSLKKRDFIFFPIKVNRKISITDDITCILQLTNYIKINNIDLVIGHTPKGALIAMIASKIAGVPRRVYFRHGFVFETANGIKRNLLITIEKITCYFSTEVISVSKSLIDISQRLKLAGNRKESLIWNGSCNGINTDYFKPTSDKNNVKNKLNIPLNGFIFGFVGRLSIDKGVVELITAWKNLITKHSNIYLILAGSVDERDPISTKLQNEILHEETIVWLGYVQDIKSLYQTLDVLVLPSYREGLPLCNLEAASCEVPVITTNKTGCKDSVVHEKTGIISDLDPKSIEDSMQLYLNNKNLINLHGKNGRQRILDEFDQKQFLKEIHKVYLNVK